MGYANIIAALTGATDDRATLSAAANLAKESKGVVRILLALPVAAASVWADAFGGTYFAAETMQAIAEANTAIRRRTETLGQALAAEFGLAYGPGTAGGRIEMADTSDTPWLTLLREAPMTDLLVIGDSLVRVEGFWSGVAAEALMYTRTPILIVRGERPVVGGVAAVCWDGSLPAGRAARAAMPLLKTATSVVVLQDPRGLSASEGDAGSPQKFKEELERRGVKTVTIVLCEGGREGPRLLKSAKAAGADLIVSGAYGHSRLGEAFFGGATRAFVDAETGAHHFLAH